MLYETLGFCKQGRKDYYFHNCAQVPKMVKKKSTLWILGIIGVTKCSTAHLENKEKNVSV